jgi:hypothetical protein
MAQQEYVCQVVQAGVQADPAGVLVLLTDNGGAFTNTWFSVPDAGKNQALAVALAAISTGNTVNVFCDPPQGNQPTTCHIIYLRAN